ncbi:MAG: phosphatase PAP2 family protein [Patescibacteria group bacterium]
MWLLIAAVFLIWLGKQPEEGKWRVLKFSLLALALTFIVGRIGGWLYDNPRPFVAGDFAPLIPHAANNGFPSDHLLLTGVFSAIVFYYNRWLGAAFWILAFIIGAARVYAGVHHWADIIGAAGIAVACVWLIARLWGNKLVSDK